MHFLHLGLYEEKNIFLYLCIFWAENNANRNSLKIDTKLMFNRFLSKKRKSVKKGSRIRTENDRVRPKWPETARTRPKWPGTARTRPKWPRITGSDQNDRKLTGSAALSTALLAIVWSQLSSLARFMKTDISILNIYRTLS